MLDISLQILSVLGIILLVLLCVVAAAILFVLFFPVSYKISGEKDAETFWLSAKADWLFSLLRVRYAYPEPGSVMVKLLWFTLYDSGAAKSTAGDDTAGEKDGGQPAPNSRAADQNTVDTGENGQSIVRSKTHAEDFSEKNGGCGKEGSLEKDGGTIEGGSSEGDGEISGEDSNGISKKFEKIKFTTCSTYDKIKKIWQNISYYVLLLQEEETRQLLSHAMDRLGRVFKHIRPRKLEAEILFGTGAPDTTGYAFGVYSVFSPALGSGVTVTPDFEHAVFEGKFDSAGYITSAVLVWQFLRVVLDRRLWRFWDKLKTGREPEDGPSDGADGGNTPQDGGSGGNSET